MCALASLYRATGGGGLKLRSDLLVLKLCSTSVFKGTGALKSALKPCRLHPRAASGPLSREGRCRRPVWNPFHAGRTEFGALPMDFGHPSADETVQDDSETDVCSEVKPSIR